MLHQKIYVPLTSYNQSSPVWHQCSQCDQLLNTRYSFPTCTFLRPGKPKSISEQHDGLWMGTINKQGLWDICLYRLAPGLCSLLHSRVTTGTAWKYMTLALNAEVTMCACLCPSSLYNFMVFCLGMEINWLLLLSK